MQRPPIKSNFFLFRHLAHLSSNFHRGQKVRNLASIFNQIRNCHRFEMEQDTWNPKRGYLLGLIIVITIMHCPSHFRVTLCFMRYPLLCRHRYLHRVTRSVSYDNLLSPPIVYHTHSSSIFIDLSLLVLNIITL